MDDTKDIANKIAARMQANRDRSDAMSAVALCILGVVVAIYVLFAWY